jgi:hypothetical protein
MGYAPFHVSQGHWDASHHVNDFGQKRQKSLDSLCYIYIDVVGRVEASRQEVGNEASCPYRP